MSRSASNHSRDGDIEFTELTALIGEDDFDDGGQVILDGAKVGRNVKDMGVLPRNVVPGLLVSA